jgi:DNA polymerase-3 subunit epsilon
VNFTAIDIETANPDMSSICQIGLARFEDGRLVKEWSSLIDPEDYFYDANISIHGIDEDAVEGQPTLPDVVVFIREFLENNIAVCHTSFDKNALLFVLEKYEIPAIETTWLDSSRVVRRTWTELSSKGYGLANVCKKIGYEFKHHDALEDAKAAGYVLLEASKQSGLDIEQWIDRVKKPINPSLTSDRESIFRTGNPEGDLYGEILVFTGELQVPRRIAADMAAAVGCQVDAGVTKKTTILVVGDQDATKLAGHEKSSKHRKAEELVLHGQKIRIIRETDFEKMVSRS